MGTVPVFERVFSTVTRTVLLAAGAVFSFAFGLEVSDNAIVVENISVPTELSDRGYTPSFVSSRIIDEWQRIGSTARTHKQAHNTNTSAALSFSRGQVDVTVPGLNVSMNSLADFFKSRMGDTRDHLTGSIVIPDSTIPECANQRCYTLYLEVNGHPIEKTMPRDQVDKLFQYAARAAVEHIDPYLLDNFYFFSTTEAEPNRDAEVARLTQIVLRHPDVAERSWANALLGVTHNRRHEWLQAVPYFNEALRLDGDNGSALNSRCWARAHIPGQLPGAIADCRAALRLNPDSEQTLDSLAFALSESGNIPLAFKTIQCARRITHGRDHGIEETYQALLARHPPAVNPTAAECQGDRLAMPPGATTTVLGLSF